MMREWDVAGRCCAGRGWWCAMAWTFWRYGFHTSAAEFCKSNQTAEKNDTISNFMLFRVYAGIILLGPFVQVTERTFLFQACFMSPNTERTQVLLNTSLIHMCQATASRQDLSSSHHTGPVGLSFV